LLIHKQCKLSFIKKREKNEQNPVTLPDRIVAPIRTVMASRCLAVVFVSCCMNLRVPRFAASRQDNPFAEKKSTK
jgi:hypothetical protein